MGLITLGALFISNLHKLMYVKGSKKYQGTLIQLQLEVEHSAHDRKVVGSIPIQC